MSIYKNKVNIDELIDINNRLNILYKNIKNNAYSDFKLETNEFNLVVDLNKEIICDLHINHTLNNNLKECYICYDKLYSNNKINTLSCTHYLCISCYNKWNISCIYNEIPTLCPFCRSSET